MKFSCGLSRQEKHKLLKEWHKWYAWFPIRVGSRDCRWFEYVNRKGSYEWTSWSWEYKAL